MINEVAPNSGISTAQSINIGFDPGENSAVTVNGQFLAGEDSIEGSVGGTLDIDTYMLQLNAGDVVDLGAYGAADNLIVLAPSGLQVIDSLSNNVDITGPRPGPNGLADARATASFVATEDGAYIVSVPGIEEGEYSISANVSRSGLDGQAANNVQYFYLDFDGAEGIDTTRFGGTNTGANLSGIAGFLENWGLSPDDENAVIDSITNEFSRIFSETGGNVVVLNSRDDADLVEGGLENVSTIVIGGTVDEAGLGVIGAGQIDVGNLDTQDSAFVLLDALSAGEDSPLFALSANNIQLGEGFSRADAVGKVVGAYAAREGGHLLGLYDTEGIDPEGVTPNVVVTDEGFFSDLAFTGEDGVLDGNDFQIGFGPDVLDGARLVGVQDSQATIAAVTQANGSGFANRSDIGTTFVTGSEAESEFSVSQSSVSITSSGTEGEEAVTLSEQNQEDNLLFIDGQNGRNTVLFEGDVPNDAAFVGGQEDDVVVTSRGVDTLFGGEGADDLNGHLGNDLVDGGAGNDAIVGSFGDDLLYGGAGDDQIDAGRDNDIVFGGAGNDRIYGRDGSDVIDGGEGNDKIAGGAGSDIFVFTNGTGQDRIYDFESGVDRIQIDNTLLGEGAGQLANEDILEQFGSVSADGQTVQLDFGNGDSITLNNPFLNLADLADDLEIV